MASSAADAASTAPSRLQMGRIGRDARRLRDGLELWLEAERDQLVLWLPVTLGAGITAWLLLPIKYQWRGAMLGLLAIACVALALGCGGRAGRAEAVGALAAAIGLALIWWRAEAHAAPVLAGPTIVTFEARVERVEPLPPRQLVRVRLAPIRAVSVPEKRSFDDRRRRYGQRDRTSAAAQPLPTLPPHLRVNIADADVPA